MPVETIAGTAPPGTANGAVPKRILIAEDNDADARLLGRKLMESGFPCEIEYSNTLHKTLKRCERSCPDLVFLDLGMPPAEGSEALEAVRNVCPSVAIVIVTGSDDNELRVRTAKLGAFSYITKSHLDVWRILSAVYSAVQWQEKAERERDLAVYYEQIRGYMARIDDTLERLQREYGGDESSATQ